MRRKLAVMLSVMLLQASACAQAPSVIYERSTKTIDIEGVSEDGAYKPVAIEVSSSGSIADTTVVSADADTTYKVSIPIADITKLYTVTVNGKMSESVNVDVYAKTDIDAALSVFSSADTADKMEKFFTEEITKNGLVYTNAEVLGFDDMDNISDYTKFYSTLSAGCSDKTTLEKATAFYNDISLSTVFCTCAEKDFSELIDQYETKLGFKSTEVYEEYKSIDAEGRQMICRILQRMQPKTASEVLEALEKGTALAAVIRSDYYVTTESLVEKHQSLLGVSLTEFNSLSSYKQDEVMKKITAVQESSAKTPEEFAQQFDEIVENIDKNNGSGSLGSPSGSGGSGGSGRVTGIGGSVSGAYSSEVASTSNSVAMAFVDMEDYEWAKEAVDELSSRGIVNGKRDYFFCPGENVTRAEIVKMLVIAFDIKGTTDIAFEDVPEDLWSYNYIKTAYANGIVNGVSDRSFAPDDFVTRQDIAVMAARVLEGLGIAKKSQSAEFLDAAEIDGYAKDSVDMMSGYGIITGMGNGSFAPKAFAKRAEAAKIIYGAIKVAMQVDSLKN